MSELRATLKPEYFDAIYTADPDPWNFADSPYEQGKYAITLNAMPKPRYRSALEVGCSIGVLTRSLASRCDAVVAIDAARDSARRGEAQMRRSAGRALRANVRAGAVAGRACLSSSSSRRLSIT